ncbi:transglycosylase SLT domain-containing protein [Streptomyces sp. URMC 127]|uniref:transglycosylase SLT domain-containing protein n=1 Tax=Streptomyces sp. URMC 127 TaxID=3423402 RepID=UPI003F1DFD2F
MAAARSRRRLRFPVALAALVAGCCVAACSAHAPDGAASAPPSGAPSSAQAGNQDPARFAPQVRAHARRADVNPQLLMAILYVESYKPHDPGLERSWQRMKPDSAFGIANMHKAAFDEAKQGRSFAGRDWQELPDDPDLAVESAAWHLHDLAASLPAEPAASYTRDELLALGYNTGAGNMRLFARGTTLGPMARSYLDRLRQNWDKAGQAVRRSS